MPSLLPSPRRLRHVAFALLGLFAVVCTIGFFWTRRLVARAETEYPQLGRFVEVEGLRMHYVERGKGRPVVMIHGAFGALQDYTATIFDPVSRRYHALAFDRPGHGYSERRWDEVGTPAVHARVLHAALNELHVDRPVIVGFSLGGAVVLAYALAYPEDVSGVVVINGVTHDWPGRVDLVDYVPKIPLLGELLVQTLVMPIGIETARAKIERAFAPERVPMTFSSSPIALALRPRSFEANAEDVRVLKDFVREESKRYGELRVPMVIVAGEGDQVSHATMHSVLLHEQVAGSELILIPSAGHQVLYTHQNVILRAIDRVCEMSVQHEAEAKSAASLPGR